MPTKGLPGNFLISKTFVIIEDMQKKSFLIFFILMLVISFWIFPLSTLALAQEEAVDRLIEISFQLTSFKKQVNQLIAEVYKLIQPTGFLNLGEFLKELFEDNEIILTKDDFLSPVEYPYLSAAQILNLIPADYENDRQITQLEADQISKQFLSLQDNIIQDGLWGKIDMHEHYWYGGNVEAFLKAAGSFGISKIVLLSTGLSPDNQGYQLNQKVLVEYYKKMYPEKIVPFCTIDESDPQAAEIFEQCLKAGGEGLKLIGGHPSFYDDPLNSENIYKVYAIAEKYEVPVLIHGSIINIPETEDQLDQIYSDFPEVTFIHAHYCSSIMSGINLEKCAKLLDDHPNLYIDLSMGGGIARYHRYLRQDLGKIKDFVLTYQDKILFGSDIILNRSVSKDFDWLYQRISCDINLHQKQEYTCAFGEKDLTHQGFNLPEEVLRKLYFENPKKVLGL